MSDKAEKKRKGAVGSGLTCRLGEAEKLKADQTTLPRVVGDTENKCVGRSSDRGGANTKENPDQSSEASPPP